MRVVAHLLYCGGAADSLTRGAQAAIPATAYRPEGGLSKYRADSQRTGCASDKRLAMLLRRAGLLGNHKLVVGIYREQRLSGCK